MWHRARPKRNFRFGLRGGWRLLRRRDERTHEARSPVGLRQGIFIGPSKPLKACWIILGMHLLEPRRIGALDRTTVVRGLNPELVPDDHACPLYREGVAFDPLEPLFELHARLFDGLRILAVDHFLECIDATADQLANVV